MKEKKIESAEENEGEVKQNKKKVEKISTTNMGVHSQFIEKEKRKNVKVRGIASTIFMAILVIVVAIAMMFQGNKQNGGHSVDLETAKARTYGEFQDSETNVDETNGCVKFKASFLKDLDGNGTAESVKGTCKRIGEQDTLYIEVIVQTQGSLKDARIEIDGKNFALQTTIPKDNEIKENAIGNDIKEIQLKEMHEGSQKLMTGVISSRIENDTKRYTVTDNKVRLVGTYVDGSNQEHAVNKEIDLTVDWYGETRAEIPTYVYGSMRNTNQERDITGRVNEEERTIKLDFDIYTQEINNELLLKKAYLEGTVPALNGHMPTEVKITGTNVVPTYDKGTGKFTATREAVLNENQEITGNVYDGTYYERRITKYTLEVTYPIEAYYEVGGDSVKIQIPVEAYYEGYNNTDSKYFNNPYKSNIAQNIIQITYREPTGTAADFDVYVGKYMYNPYYRYMVSKKKPLRIYNDVSSEEKEDRYIVRWVGYTGTSGESNGMIMTETTRGAKFAGTNNTDGGTGEPKDNTVDVSSQVVDKFVKTGSQEDSMENVTTNVGIYFSNAINILGEEGWIKVYDETTDELVETFTNKDWGKYTENSPYIYETPLKHIRIETSATKKESSLTVYNVKELDDEYITTNYTREQFDELTYIESTLTGYLGGTYITTSVHQARYEAPMSEAEIDITPKTMSTQETAKNTKITIKTNVSESNNLEEWQNGSFLVKLPEEIIDAEINNVEISAGFRITSSEVYKAENAYFIKINTENSTPSTCTITIDCNITPDPRKETVSRTIELYASNEAATDYYSKVADKYDVNSNSNVAENVGRDTISVSLIAPGSLLTNQVAKNYDTKSSEAVSPQIAEVERKTINDAARTADIEVQLKNNYARTITNIQILGKIPFTGNEFALSEGKLGSTFTAEMVKGGIKRPAGLETVGKIYYSEEENPTVDIEEPANKWNETVSDWSKVRSYLIDLGEYTMNVKQELIFTYTINVPSGVKFNEVSYSHHGVIFALNTDQGKYFTQTEPNKLGFRVARKFDLELTKYHKNKTKVVEGATYKVTAINADDSEGKTKTATTDASGKLTINDLLVEQKYVIEEIKSPSEYELNEGKIEITANVGADGNIQINSKDENNVLKQAITVEAGTTNYVVKVVVQDEAKANIKITKTDKASGAKLSKIRYKLTGPDLPEKGKTLTTNADGIATLKGLKIGEEYKLEEVKADGYYLAETITFRVVNNGGSYTVEKTTGEPKTINIITDKEIPTVNIEVQDDKIPTYNLIINKVAKEGNTPLAGAKLRLFKGTEKIADYVTEANGQITIPGLYQYETARDIDQTYTLKEILAPEGYAKIKDIKFRVENKDGKLEMQVDEGIIANQTSTDTATISITIEDSPSFKLVKKDGETTEPLPGTKFAIYNVDDGSDQLALDSKFNILGTKETINGKEYYTLTTNERGEITADLREGLYKAVEIKANNEKYDITNNVYYFGIGVSREAITDLGATWSEVIGGNTEDQVTAIAETEDGGYIVGGYFTSETIEVGGQTLENKGDYGYSDGYIIKYNAKGEVEKTEVIGGSKYENVKAIAVTEDGGYIVGGYFTSETIEVEGELLSNKGSKGSQDGYIIKYNAEGKIEKTEVIGGTLDEDVTAIEVTENGEYIVGGSFKSYSVQIGIKTMMNNRSGYEDGYIIKYGSDGEIEKAEVIGGNGNDYVTAIAVTEEGGYIVGGYFNSSSIEVGNQKLTNKGGGYDGYIIKYDAEGKVEKTEVIGGSYYDEVAAIAETEEGGYIIGGRFSNSSIEVGNQKLTNKGGYDVYIIKYSVDGEIEKAETIAGYSNDYIKEIEVVEDGSYIVGGYFDSGTIEVGGQTLENKGSQDGYIIKYNAKGEVEKTEVIGGNGNDYVTAIAGTKDGGYIVGGYFKSSSIEVGGQTLKGKGSADGYIIKFEEVELPNIVANRATGFGGSNNDEVTAVAVTRDGGYIVGGYFDSSSIEVGGQTLENKGGYAGCIIKYNAKGEIEKTEVIGGSKVTAIAVTEDGGYIVGGDIYSSTIEVGAQTLENKGGYDGYIIKYNAKGEVEKTEVIGGNDDDYITAIAVTKDGGYIVGGYFESSSISVGGQILTNKGGYDGYIIKYGSDGEIEKAEVIGGNKEDEVTAVAVTEDGGYIVGGYFYSKSIEVGDQKLINKGNYDGYIIKYSVDGEIEKTEVIGGDITDYVTAIAVTKDGGYIVGGYFSSETIEVGGQTLEYKGGYDGYIIKYNAKGEVEKTGVIGGSKYDYITAIAVTKDGGYIVGGYFESSSIEVGAQTLENKGDYDGYIIKYDEEANAEWAKGIGGNGIEHINTVAELEDGSILAGGYYKDTFEIDNKTLTNSGREDGMVIQLVNETGVPEQNEIEALNYRKELQITTEVEKINGVKGGKISGEGLKPYEKVKYGETSKAEIKMTPDPDYEIIKVTINGEEQKFTVNPTDRTYTLDKFPNMTEDKHIVVTYAQKDHKVIIQKVDKENKPIEQAGVQFKLDQIEERGEPTGVIGSWVANGETYTEVVKGAEVNGVVEENNKQDKSDYYFTKNESNQYIPTNGGKQGLKTSTTANSYIPINLTADASKKYVVVINAEISTESNCDYGYATISTDTTFPSFKKSSTMPGEFMKKAGKIAADDYTSGILQGGTTYYLHLGYYKDSSSDSNEDLVKINSIKVYEATGKEVTYNFVPQNGKYESNNQGKANTVASSYVEINLQNCQGKYNITVNAGISSQSSGDYGYVAVTTSEERPTGSTGRFISISGKQEEQAYTTEVTGGSKYYLHFQYNKNSDIDTNEDKFIIGDIAVTLSSSELYHTTLETNSEGQAIGQIPFGKYQVTETVAPEGYVPLKESETIEFRENGTHTFTIQNEKLGELTVHHYLKNRAGVKTTTPVADPEEQEGAIGSTYSTKAHLDLPKYDLEKDASGNYVLPPNAAGTYQNTPQTVDYYYEERKIPLIVHHYIQGTVENVPLKNGTAQDATGSGYEGDTYNTTPYSEEQLNPKYELVETPGNATGTYEGEKVEVTYYYKAKEVKITTKVQTHEETDILGQTNQVAGGEITGDGSTLDKPLETVIYGETSEEDIVAKPKEGYRVKSITVNERTITNQANAQGEYFTEKANHEVEIGKFVNMTENKHIVVEFMKAPTSVIVHHYIAEENANRPGTYTYTTTRVPAKTEGVVADETKIGLVGDMYGTEVSKNIQDNYEYLEVQGPASGLMTETQIEVKYYYKLKQASIEESNITKESSTERVLRVGQKIPYTITYEADIIDYIGDGTITIVDNLPYTIDAGQSQIANGEYNAGNKTITWTYNVKGINSFTEGNTTVTRVGGSSTGTAVEATEASVVDGHIVINKTIELIYTNVDTADESVDNNVEGTIHLTTPEVTDKVTDDKQIRAEYEIDVPVAKIWNDSSNAAGKRPAEVTLVLTGTAQGYSESVEQKLTSANAKDGDTNRWEYTFRQLPKYTEAGNEITYTVSEKGIKNADGSESIFYLATNATTDQASHTITNQFVVPEAKVQVPVEKIWTYANEIQAKKIPESITFTLTSSDTSFTAKTLTLTAQNISGVAGATSTKWAGAFTGLPKYDANGNVNKYTVTENATGTKFYVQEGEMVEDRTSVTETTEGKWTATNKFVVPNEKVQVPVEKVWEDNETQAKRRSTEITLELTSSDKAFAKKEVTINATEHASKTDRTKWEYTFTELPKYDANGEENVYSVTEKELDNKFYKQQKQPVRDETSKKITITNTFVMPEDKVQVPVEKIWTYANTIQAQKIPTSITFTITSSDPTFVSKTLTLNSANISGAAGATSTKWAGVFTNLPKYNANGEENRYTVTENGTGTKFYVQEGNMVEDRKNVTDTIEGKWTATNKFVVPNETIQIPVAKAWNDSNNVAGKRPTSVTMVLTGTGAGINSTNKITLSSNSSSASGSAGGVGTGTTDSFGNTIAKVNGADNTWAYTFTNMKKYDNNGDEIVYTVSEENILNADGTESIFYLAKNATVDQKSHTITNKFIVPNEKVQVPVEKVWEDNETQAKRRSTEITLELTSSDKTFAKKEVTINATEHASKTNRTKWEYTFTELPKYDANGNENVYTVTEKELDNKFYKQQKQPVRDEASKKITITNTFVMPEDKVQVPVEKVWIYANDIQAKKIPTEITFTIATNTDETFEERTLTLNASNIVGEAGETSTKWAGVFTELPKYNANGEENRYTVTENGTGTKFYAQEGNMIEDRTNVTETVEGKWTATNKFVVPDERIQIPVTKAWNDSNNVAGKRPTSVTIVLTGTGAGINSTNKITLSSLVGSTGGVGTTDSFGNTIAKVNGADNTWAYTFTNMKKYDNNGDEITYTVSEENILNTDGSESIFYLVKNATVDQKSHTITNKFIVPDVRIELPVAKHWDDNSNKAKKRSTEITLVLTGTGEQVKTTYKVTLTTIAGNANPGNNIVAVDGTEDTWYYTFTNLPKYDAYGDDIIYTIDEEETGSKFYIEKNKQINPILRIVTNKFEVPDERIKVVVTKDWQDNSNKYGKRPTQITITLKGVGSNFSYEDSKVITAEQASETDTNKWICEFTNLKRYDENGDDIAYTVDEIVPKTGEKVAGDGEILVADDFSYYDKTVSKMGELDEETYIREATITNDMTRIPGKLTTKFVDKATGEEISDKIEREQAVGTPFDVSKDRKEIEEWELVQEPDPKTGTYTEEPQTKTYYYLKKTSVLVHHYIAKENRDADGTYNGTYTYTEDRVPSKVKGQVVQDQLIPGLDTQHYDTYPSDEIQANYELVEMPGNASGEMTKEQIVVKYYYKYKMPEIEEEKITKESSTDIVIKEDQKIPYTITYEVKFKEYMGDARIVVVDQLPYEIDFAKSYLAGGVYDEARKTITWEYEMNEINTFEEGSKHVIVSQKIELVYKNIDVTDKMIENTVTGTVRLLTPDYTSKTTDKEDIPANYIIDVPITKVWQDNNNAKGKRPETVTMILTGTTDAGYSKEYRQVLSIANARKVAEGTGAGANTGASASVGAEANVGGGSGTGAGAINTNVWEYVFKDLPKYDEAGNIIKYEVSEETGSVYYTIENAQIDQDARTITNVFKVPETKIKVVVTKEWQDTSNIKQKRPESLVLVLRGTGANYNKEIRQTITREENEKQANRDEWEYTFTNLQKYDENGDEIVYTVSEEVVNANDLYYYDRVPSNAASGVAVTALSGQNVSDISGEEIAVNSKTEENVKEATIINKMTRQPGKVTVKYVDKNNEQEISTPVEKEDAVGNNFDVREDKKEIPGYTLVGEPDEPTGKYAEEPQEKVYYYAKNTEVQVKYLEKGTNKVLMTFEAKDREGKPVVDEQGKPVIQNYDVIYGYEGKEYSTELKEIPNYTFVNSTNNTEGLMERETIEVIYYYVKNTKVIVKYLEQDNTLNDNTDNKVLKTFEAKDEEGNPVLDTEGKPVIQNYDVIYGYVGKEYKTKEEKIEGYTFIKHTQNIKGTMTEDVIEVIYYYAQNTKVVVRYLEQDDTPEDNTDNLELTNVLKDEEGNIIVDENGNPKQEILKYEEEGFEGLPYKTKYKEVQDYTFVGDTGNTEGTMTKDVIEVIYYYLKNTSAKVQHIDKATGEILKEEEEEGKVGDWFRTHPEDFENYVLVETPELPDVQMKKDEEVVVKYYYAHISEGLIEKHIDIITGELLAAEIHEGNEGDPYEILPKEFPIYELVEIDEEGNNRLPTNAKGTMTKELIEVRYYYIKKATLRVQYLDKLGGEVIGQDEEGNDIHEGSKIIPDIVENKHEKDKYTTEAKEFDGYILVEVPENAEGTIEITKNEDGTYNTETLVQYYYIKKAKVIEKHIDIDTGETIEEETHEGKEGDEYEVEPKEFPEYDIVEKDDEGNSKLPENNKGKMTGEEIVVEYYYRRKTKVEVEYIDKDTGELLDEDEIDGHVGDEYTTEERQFDKYDLVEKTDNTEGKMTKETIEVKYYYRRRSEVEVKYLEKGTDYAVEEEEHINGYINDPYTTEQKEVQYYRLVETTDNTEGKMGEKKTEVIYYYEKLKFDLRLEKYVAEATVNGEKQVGRSYEDRDKLFKLEIHRKKIEKAQVKIKYKLRVINDGEIEGTADRILENIPEGYSYYPEDNVNSWRTEEETGNKTVLVTRDLANEKIQPGEYKEVEIVLRWNRLEGEVTKNTALISGTINPAKFADVDKNNDSDDAEMMIVVSTGDTDETIMITIDIIITLMLAAGLIVYYKKNQI